jgi:ubiquinone biosynthesis protein
MHLAELVWGVTKNDADMVMRAAVAIADVDPDTTDLKGARVDVQELVARFVGVPLERIDLADVLDDFFQTLRRYDLRCPPDIVLLIKAMSTIEGVATAYDPTFDMVGFTRPYVEKLLKSRFSPQAIAKQARETAMAFLSLVRDTPHELSSLFRRIRTNRMRMQMDVVGIEDLNATIDAASEKLSFAVQIASLVMASSVLVLASNGEGFVFHVGIAGFVISATFASVLMLAAWRRRRKVARRSKIMRQARGEE